MYTPDCQEAPAAPVPVRVVVVVPVYRDSTLTRACIASAMPAVMRLPGARMLVINDCSPEPKMDDVLAAEEARWGGRLLVMRNASNLGFVKTANRGIRFDPAADVVLLNNDVIVPDQWLERMVEDAYGVDAAGTVTPLSNNTTISAFPNYMRENDPPLQLPLDAIDRSFQSSRLDPVEAPSGIGFCMYIKRRCLVDVGDLDEQAFGTGYGEENDFCQRAAARGWKNFISPNLYVYHKGGVSFQDTRDERLRHANQVLDRRYPNYHADVQRFAWKDPLRPARLRRLFDLVSTCGQPIIVHVTHGRGGGVDQHVQELARLGEGRAVSLLLQPADHDQVIALGLWNADESMKLVVKREEAAAMLLPLLRALRVSLVHFHHVMGWPPELLLLGPLCGARQVFTCHDFYLVNANPTLTGPSGVFDPMAVDRVVNPLYPLPTGMTMKAWQQQFHAFLAGCERVIFPSAATAQLFTHHLAVSNAVIAYHPEVQRADLSALRAFTPRPVYTVGVLGALSREKGADLLEALALQARRTNRNVRFVLVGYAYRPLKQVQTTGPYDADKAAALIERECCDALLFTALWPETYSYTLSVALSTGLPIAAPAIGAFPERLSGRPRSWVFPFPSPAASLLDGLCNFLSDLQTGVARFAPTVRAEPTPVDLYEDEYFAALNSEGVSRPEAAVHEALAALLVLPPMPRVNGRERMLKFLWLLYSDKRLRRITNIIPHRVKRGVKRLLSRKPLHEVLRRG